MAPRTSLVVSLMSLVLSVWLGSLLHGGEPASTVQVHFAGPAKMRVYWQVSREGKFCTQPLVVPANLNFRPRAVYRLKLTHIPGYEGVTLYPSLEIAGVTPGSAAFLAHSKIPIKLTEQDFAQVSAGRLVRKVVHLPRDDDRFVTSRGPVLAILRLGNRDLEPKRPSPAKKAKQ